MIRSFNPIPLIVGLLVAILVVGGAGWYVGRNAGTVKAQVRIDSLSTKLNNCQADVAKAKTGAQVAGGFLQDYDKRIAELEDEKRIQKNAFTDTIAVLRRYNAPDAERAIAAYYYRRRQQQGAKLDVP